MKTSALIVVLSCVAVGSAAFAKDDVNAPKDFDAVWRQPGNMEQKESAFRKYLEAARAKPAPDKDYIGQVLTQIARSQGIRGALDRAHATLDEAAQVLQDEESIGRVRYLLERGRCYNSAGLPEQACEAFHEAFELAKARNADFYAIDAAHMLGIAETADEALAWNLRAIKMAERTRSERAKGWRGPLYNNVGWVYFESGDYEKALAYFRKNAAFRRAREDDDRFARYSEGKALRMLEEYDKALVIQYALAASYKKENREDGFVHEEIAEILWAIGSKDAAKKHFARAYELLRKTWVKDDVARMRPIRERAGIPKPDDEPDLVPPAEEGDNVAPPEDAVPPDDGDDKAVPADDGDGKGPGKIDDADYGAPPAGGNGDGR